MVNADVQDKEPARELYVQDFQAGFPSKITISTLCPVLYALRPEVFPLVNSYVSDSVESIITKKLDKKSASDYISAADALGILLDNLTKETDLPRHFGVIDRVMAITSDSGDTIDLNTAISSTPRQQSGKSTEHNMPSKNQILYGAAGTGKTYRTQGKRTIKALPSRQINSRRMVLSIWPYHAQPQ